MDFVGNKLLVAEMMTPCAIRITEILVARAMRYSLTMIAA